MRQGKKVEKGELLYEIDNENIIVERRHIKKDLEEKRNLYNAMTGKRHIKDTLVVNFFNKKQSHAIDIETLNSQIEEQEKDVYSNSEIYKIGGLSKIEFEKSKR